MTTWVCLKISAADGYSSWRKKKEASVIEINHWYLDREVHDYFGLDDIEILDMVKLRVDTIWESIGEVETSLDDWSSGGLVPRLDIKATDTKGWKWGSGEIIMKKEEFENYNWKESKEFLASDYEFELGSLSDVGWSDIEFKNLHEENEADESDLYGIVRDYGELEDYEVWFIGPINVEIVSDWYGHELIRDMYQQKLLNIGDKTDV